MDYPTLVHRVRELVWEHVPAGSTVAVVSKGDPDLILFDQRHGLHFPQTAAGEYLGHHPASGAAAVAHLESIRQRGAQYFVLPATSAWWFDYYRDVRQHLDRIGDLVHGDDVCTIYSLSKRDSARMPTSTAVERQLRELVAAVLPEGARLLALGVSRSALSGAEFDLCDGSLEELHAGAAVGAEYLVIPVASDDLRKRCAAKWRLVLHQRHVCTVFALSHGHLVAR